MITDERRIAELERKTADLLRVVQSGSYFSSGFGAPTSRPQQIGFAAKLTGSYNATTGYPWTARELPTDGPIADATNPVQGNHAWEIAGDTTLLSGQKVWLEPDTNARGWVFVGPVGFSPPPPGTSFASGEVVLSTFYDITANATWEDVGLVTTTLAAGTYHITLTVRGQAQESGSATGGGQFLQARLWDNTAAATVGGTCTAVFGWTAFVATGPTWSGSGSTSFTLRYVVASPRTIKVQAWRGIATTWNIARIIASDCTRVVWLQVA